jgi:hypothetical protein
MTSVTIEFSNVEEALHALMAVQVRREEGKQGFVLEREREVAKAGDLQVEVEGWEREVAAVIINGGGRAEILAAVGLQEGLDQYSSGAVALAEMSPDPEGVPGAGAAAGVIVPPSPPPPPLAEELDSAGAAWNAAVHSANRTKNVDGTWRKRRVTDVPAPPPAFAAVPQPPAAVPVPPPGWPQTVQELMPLVTRAMVAGALTPAAIGEACRSVGITALPDLATRPELIPAMCVALGVAS